MSAFDESGRLRRYRRVRGQDPAGESNPADVVIRVLDDPEDQAAAAAAEAARRSAAGEPEGDLRVGVLLEDRYVGTFVRDAVLFPDGSRGLYNRILGVDGCLVLPILKGRVVMIRIFRHATRRWLLEFPGGSVSPGTAPEIAAREELEEEVGGSAATLHNLGACFPTPALSNERYHLFAAEVESVGRPQRAEAIAEIVSFAPDALEPMIERGEICDLPSIALIARARMRGFF